MNLRLFVKQLAEAQGLDRAKLSRRADLNIATVNRVWKDPNTEIDPVETDTLQKLANALGVSVKELIADDDKASQ